MGQQSSSLCPSPTRRRGRSRQAVHAAGGCVQGRVCGKDREERPLRSRESLGARFARVPPPGSVPALPLGSPEDLISAQERLPPREPAGRAGDAATLARGRGSEAAVGARCRGHLRHLGPSRGPARGGRPRRPSPAPGPRAHLSGPTGGGAGPGAARPFEPAGVGAAAIRAGRARDPAPSPGAAGWGRKESGGARGGIAGREGRRRGRAGHRPPRAPRRSGARGARGDRSGSRRAPGRPRRASSRLPSGSRAAAKPRAPAVPSPWGLTCLVACARWHLGYPAAPSLPLSSVCLSRVETHRDPSASAS